MGTGATFGSIGYVGSVTFLEAISGPIGWVFALGTAITSSFLSGVYASLVKNVV